MRRKLRHFLGMHTQCHPSNCRTAADIVNQFWSDNEYWFQARPKPSWEQNPSFKADS